MNLEVEQEVWVETKACRCQHLLERRRNNSGGCGEWPMVADGAEFDAWLDYEIGEWLIFDELKSKFVFHESRNRLSLGSPDLGKYGARSVD